MTDVEVNRSLEHLARRLATAVEDREIRDSIYRTAGQRFDGDANVLLSTLMRDSNFSEKIAESREARAELVSMAAAIPRLQVAIPEHFDSWNPATYIPLVAFFPEGVDDTTLKTITAYDSTGKAVRLDAQATPKHPVIVVGLNERVGDGEGIGAWPTPSPDGEVPLQATAAAKYSVDIVLVELIDDKEPWAKGDAEISMRAKSKGCSGTNYQDYNWEHLNDSGDDWAPEGGRNLGTTRCDVVFYWWEDDGGSFDYTLSYGGFGLDVHMDDSDDLIGGKLIKHSSFKGGTMEADTWSALEQWTK
ncbi:DUF3103 family protein [Nocardioides daejeonensis]|uniref:DUF3103 family protein n=1 Tax=Nocardioides daejeonensis TaxID=1046556 RepID=UPI0013A54FB3|nr:DUF3103 family protein [Nocardioides daejeonensis]